MKLLGTRWLSTSANSVKAYYATTPIFYVNAKPHLGHLHSMVLTDTLARWQRFMGRDSLMMTGTDEHGSKVAQAAAKAGIEPQPFVDALSASFLELANKANIDYFRFMRTTDADHVATAQRIWSLLLDRGYIYKGKHGGWYSISDETFVSETDLEKQPDGSYLTKDLGNAVEWWEEDNYFFKLSAFQDKLVHLFEQNPGFVLPKARHSQLVTELKTTPLRDLSISRPTDRCSWGIPVPGDSSQVMYVWFEALINYVTAAESAAPTKAWPADVHVVGKDIMKFHAIYWPAFLMAAEMEVPKSVLVHSHWTMEGIKMSKSKNNVVDPIQAIDNFGLDTIRYFLMHDASLDHDTPFSYPRVIERHNVNLVNKLGNLISRVCGPKFDIPRAMAATPSADVESTVSLHAELIDSLNKVVDRSAEHMRQCETSRVLYGINDVAMLANQYFQDNKPWDAEPEKRDTVVRTAAETCRILTLLLQPFCPEYASRMLDRLAVQPGSRTWAHAVIGADKSYGVGANRKGDVVLQRLPEIK